MSFDTSYAYDCFGRVVSETTAQGSPTLMIEGQPCTVPQKTRSLVYDGVGRVLIEKVNGQITAVRRFDLAGNRVAHLNGDGDGVTVDFSSLAQRITTETTVWGIGAVGHWGNLWNRSIPLTTLVDTGGAFAERTVITERFKDRSLFKRHGTAVVQEEHDYEVVEGYYGLPAVRIIHSVFTGSSDPLLTRTGTDMIGRVVFRETRSFAQDGKILLVHHYEHDLPPFFEDGDSRMLDLLPLGGTGSGQVSRVSTVRADEHGQIIGHEENGEFIPERMTADTLYEYDHLGRLAEETLDVPPNYVKT